MPRRLVQVRHGQSEANVAQKEVLEHLDPAVIETLSPDAVEALQRYTSDVVDAIYRRPDWQQRLSPFGIEQARVSGDWIRRHIGALASFDIIYVSPFMRTCETAAYAAGDEDVSFVFDDRIIERDWGLYGKLAKGDQEKFYPDTYRHKKDNPLYARLDGGESPMDVYARSRDMHGTLHREFPDGRVLMFTHGDLMSTERYVNERMLPEEWVEMIRDPFMDFRNGSVLDWSRENPDDPEDVREKLNWVRLVHPNSPQLSPFGGAWVEMKGKRRYSVQDALGRAAAVERLIPDSLLGALRAAEDEKVRRDSERFRARLDSEHL